VRESLRARPRPFHAPADPHPLNTPAHLDPFHTPAHPDPFHTPARPLFTPQGVVGAQLRVERSDTRRAPFFLYLPHPNGVPEPRIRPTSRAFPPRRPPRLHPQHDH
jgi:hypothetical protein